MKQRRKDELRENGSTLTLTHDQVIQFYCYDTNKVGESHLIKLVVKLVPIRMLLTHINIIVKMK